MPEDTVPVPSKIKAWIHASRPKTLSAAITPVMVGTAIAAANGSFKALPALAALYCAIAIQIGTNIFNDVMDFERGTDTDERMGPLRVTQAGWLTAAEVRRGAMIVFASAGIIGLYLITVGGWPVLLLGIASILAGLAYTAGPSPLAYNGFGDLFVMLFFGFAAVGGTVYVQVNALPASTWFAAGAVGSTITALLGVNNIRDIETDRRAGRRTIPVLIGRNAAIIEYGVLLAASFLLPAIAAFAGRAPLGILLCWLAIPMAVKVFGELKGTQGKALNRVLAGTARLVFVHGLLLTVGFLTALF